MGEIPCLLLKKELLALDGEALAAFLNPILTKAPRGGPAGLFPEWGGGGGCLASGFFGAASDPAGGEGLHVRQALEQVGARGGDGVAVAAVVYKTGFAQFLDAGVERVGGDAPHAVLQQAEGLGVTVLQGPQHAQCVTAFEPLEQLVDGGIFFGAHGRFSSRKCWIKYSFGWANAGPGDALRL